MPKVKNGINPFKIILTQRHQDAKVLFLKNAFFATLREDKYQEDMQNSRGTYALIGACDTHQRVVIGKLGRLRVRPGYYVYVGSAFGPGGLNARLAHHTRASVRPHWHIDYLRSVLLIKEVWYTNDDRPYEHRWAETISGIEGATTPITGFGSSDCSCTSHLFTFKAKPSIRSFRQRLHARIPSHGSILQHRLIEGSGCFPDRVAP